MTRYVGTAGWTVPTRYSAEVPAQGSHLERYAQRLPAVEINSSFYRSHQRETYERWAQSVARGFRFAVKMPRAVTHECRLRGTDSLVGHFAEEVGGLGDKLGAVLVQLPASLSYETAVVEDFFIGLRRHVRAPVVCEPRHPGWFVPEVEAMLAALQVGRVAADPAPAPGADRPGGWRGIAYFRLHGNPRMYYSDYGAAALAAYRDAVAAEAARGVPAWCIFDNTAAFAALGNALAVMDETADSRAA